MSQHYFGVVHGGVVTTILMGWDRPLQGFFMVIEKDGDENADYPFWSNLDCEESYPKSLDPFLNVLSELDICLPSQMIIEMMDDKAKNMGNKTVFHSVIDGVYQRDGK